MTESCYYGKHLMTKENGIKFPGSRRVNCLACERFLLKLDPEKFWRILAENLKWDCPDELWAARCARYEALVNA